MMNELLSRVTEKTGLSPDQAKSATEAVLGFLRERMPAPLASGMDSLLGGGEASGQGMAGKAAGALGGLFGSKS